MCHRHDTIATHVPRPYWTVQASVRLGELSGGGPAVVRFASSRGPVWSEAEAEAVVAAAAASGEAAAAAVAVSDSATRVWCEPRPPALNTVALLKAASEELGISPGDAMHYAERLYLSGLTSYPRTETSCYAPGFDLEGTLRCLSERDEVREWLPQAAELYRDASASASAAGGDLGAALAARASLDGVDVGDHPPITPVKLATPRQCEGEAGWAVYQYICRHFVASLSADCT